MNNSSISRVIWGTGITLLGIGFLLDALNVVAFDNVAATWWPLLIVIGGVGALVGNPRSYVVPLAFIAVGILVQLDVLNVIQVNIGNLVWPIAVIAVGLAVLFKQGFSRTVTLSSDTTDVFAVMGGADMKVTSKHYKGGKASAIMGGVTLDLRKAKLSDGAELEVFALMGGIELKVPEDWHVNVAGTPVLGGWENKSLKPEGKAPVLNVNATCVMGGIEIKN